MKQKVIVAFFVILISLTLGFDKFFTKYTDSSTELEERGIKNNITGDLVVKPAVVEYEIENGYRYGDRLPSTISNLETPPGRKIDKEKKIRSNWFNSLDKTTKELVRDIITSSVDEALFGFLAVIDGVRKIDDGSSTCRLILTYSSNENVILNEPSEADLHDLYNQREHI
jgi:hypothetical protein